MSFKNVVMWQWDVAEAKPDVKKGGKKNKKKRDQSGNILASSTNFKSIKIL